MKILITGATGFVGKSLAKSLIEDGHELVLLTRSTKNFSTRFPYPAKVFAWKGLGLPPKEAFTGVEAIIHLAGESVAAGRWTKAQKQKIFSSRADGTRDLLAGAAEFCRPAPRVVISASAVGIYGSDRGDEIVSENGSIGNDFLAEVTRAWEKELFTAPLPNSVRRACLRIGLVLGKDGGVIQKLLPLAKLGLLGNLGNGRQWTSWIHIDDLVAQFKFLLQRSDLVGAFNAVSEIPTTNGDFTRALTKALGVWRAPPVPSFILKLAAGEMSGLLLGSLRVSPDRLKQSGFNFRFTDIQTALQSLLKDLDRNDEFVAEQWFPKKKAELFPFFSDARNLEAITPKILHFRVLKTSTKNVEEGTLIDYRLRINGIPAFWRTRIESWNPPTEFVDTQLRGPYARWHHTHSFYDMAGGTLMRDRVLYRLPMGFIGRLLAGWKVRQDVRHIFSFRHRTLEDKFGSNQR